MENKETKKNKIGSVLIEAIDLAKGIGQRLYSVSLHDQDEGWACLPNQQFSHVEVRLRLVMALAMLAADLDTDLEVRYFYKECDELLDQFTKSLRDGKA